MATQRRKYTTREKIYNEKIKIWDLYCKSRVQEALENTKEQTYKDIYSAYRYSYVLWGGVEFEFWLEALAKKFKSYDSDLESVAIFSLPKRTRSDREKIVNLEVIAKLMGLDVAITSNRPLKPALVVKPRATPRKVKPGPGQRGGRVA